MNSNVKPVFVSRFNATPSNLRVVHADEQLADIRSEIREEAAQLALKRSCVAAAADGSD